MKVMKLPHDHGTSLSEEFHTVLETTDFQGVSDIFKQLSDKTRLQIYWLLCHHEDCVINLSAILSMSSPAVSHHLRILKSSRLIESRREGKEVYYKATENEVSKQLHIMIEIMMAIHCPEDAPAFDPSKCDTKEMVKEIHKKITENLDKRYTIDDLSAEYHMNTTTLKNTFKTVYGMPVASYMKRYRIDTAATMLRDTKNSIAQVACAVGYESQGKFTNAFKEQYGLLPSEYRKENQ